MNFKKNNNINSIRINLPLFLIIIITSLFGITILYSASSYSNLILIKQLINLIIAIVAMVIISQIPPRLIRHFAPYLLTLGIILLILVAFIGTTRGGATRWLNIGITTFQPSEMMKIIVPIAISAILSDKTLPPKAIPTITSIVLILIISTLILIQPDLGTAIIVGSSGIFVLFFSGLSIKIFKNIYINIISIIFIIIGAITSAWLFLLKSYQKERILTLFNPELDELGRGYHIIQSKIAIGSGGFFGKGYGKGTQSQLDFLPEHATDFIFATIAEELGFLGILFLLFLYTLIIHRCLLISIKATDIFAKLLGTSIAMIFFTYVFINIAMVSGILPVVGIPLPLISYGGSSLLTIFIGFGIIMSINKYQSPKYLY